MILWGKAEGRLLFRSQVSTLCRAKRWITGATMDAKMERENLLQKDLRSDNLSAPSVGDS